MISQSAIHIDGGRAWLVVSSPVDAEVALDRPCDTCEGDGIDGSHDAALFYAYSGKLTNCDPCDGTGRHTFEIEVESYPHGGCPSCGDSGIGRSGDGFCSSCSYPDTLRVHVVPGMVLPIVYDASEVAEVDAGFIWNPGPRWYERYQMGEPVERVTLPPDARPGMWAVQLEVHEQHH